MTRIFLSYAHEDQAAARRIVASLAREGLRAWWDHEIPPGRTWDEMIGARIKNARVVIVLWSKGSVASHFVKEEAQLALDAGKLLPLCIESIEPPIGFRRVQATNLSTWRGDPDHAQWRVVLAEIHRRLGIEPADRQTARTKLPRLRFVVTAIAAFSLLGLGLYSHVNADRTAPVNASARPPERTVSAARPPTAAAARPTPASAPRRPARTERLTSSSAIENLAQTVWQGPVFRSSGRASEWAVRFNEDGTAAIDFLDGRGFLDTGDWSWTQDGRTVLLRHGPSGNYAEATIHDRELSGVLTAPSSPRDSGTFRFTRR